MCPPTHPCCPPGRPFRPAPPPDALAAVVGLAEAQPGIVGKQFTSMQLRPGPFCHFLGDGRTCLVALGSPCLLSAPGWENRKPVKRVWPKFCLIALQVHTLLTPISPWWGALGTEVPGGRGPCEYPETPGRAIGGASGLGRLRVVIPGAGSPATTLARETGGKRWEVGGRDGLASSHPLGGMRDSQPPALGPWSQGPSKEEEVSVGRALGAERQGLAWQRGPRKFPWSAEGSRAQECAGDHALHPGLPTAQLLVGAEAAMGPREGKPVGATHNSTPGRGTFGWCGRQW